MPKEKSQSEKQRRAREQVLLADRIMDMLKHDPFVSIKEHLKDDLRETLQACEDAPVQRRDIRAVATYRVRRKIIKHFQVKLHPDEGILKRAAGLTANRLLDEVCR